MRAGHPTCRVMVSCGRVIRNIVKTLIFTILLPGTVAVYIPDLLRGHGPQVVSSLGWVGLAPMAVGVDAYLWCAWDFATFGRGTPLPLDALCDWWSGASTVSCAIRCMWVYCSGSSVKRCGSGLP